MAAVDDDTRKPNLARDIRTVDDVLRLLDGLFAPEADRWTANAGSWWDGFYSDRSRPVPFFVAKPDEHLVSYLDRGLITPGRALDLGAGPGRKALHLAWAGFTVDAVDLSPAATAWAMDRAREADAEIRTAASATSPSSTDPSRLAAISPSPASRLARWAPSSRTPSSTATPAWMAASPTRRSPYAGSSPT